ncbi:FAD-dependent oxidoreductase [Lyngbya aestuarii]|uniref:FAD-dependent oxidoreductase n=1 Tax=Lyngbya aestuarii TaxID=118322 RepID=UPI00403D8E41
MTVEYDLIVIGGSSAATYAAVTAAQMNARVALVEPQCAQTNCWGDNTIYTQALTQVVGFARQRLELSPLGIDSQTTESTQPVPTEFPWQIPTSWQLTEAMQWAKALVSTKKELNDSAVLASLGIDVISGIGEFCRRPHLGFVVNNRRLTARFYLIATGSRPNIPDIEGLQQVGYLTPQDIWVRSLKADDANFQASKLEPVTPQFLGNWVVIGGDLMGIQLAQTLVRLQCDVTLVMEASNILPAEDLEASHLVQAQLEAEGVRVLTNSPVTQVRWLEDKKWVQAGDNALEADEIVIANGQQANLESLNLEGVGVKFNQRGLKLNAKLQTTNPCIYACGNVAGGYQFAHIAEYEAGIALKNALFIPIFKVDYRGIPWAIFCDPQLARVGLTEAQARRRYGKDVFVVRQYFKTLDKAQLLGETTGFCKLAVRRNGEILGASIVGPEASELIGAIALAMRQNIRVGALAELPQVSLTLSEIINKTAGEWRWQRFGDNHTLQNFLEGFFKLRRHWS